MVEHLSSIAGKIVNGERSKGLLEEVNERIWLHFDPQAESRQSEAPHPPLLSLYCMLCPPFPQQEPFQGLITTLREQCVVKTIWLVYVLSPVKASIWTFKILKGRCVNLLIF